MCVKNNWRRVRKRVTVISDFDGAVEILTDPLNARKCLELCKDGCNFGQQRESNGHKYDSVVRYTGSFYPDYLYIAKMLLVDQMK